MLKSTLKNVLKTQLSQLLTKSSGLERRVHQQLFLPESHALIVSGVRRSGKSTLLHQLLSSTGEGSYYLNFEDPKLYPFDKFDYSRLDELLAEMGCKTLFLDEIQVVEDWERYIRHLLDTGYRVVITGSNASLLSKELGTKLTGRHISFELFPFSFGEYLAFEKKVASEKTLLKYLHQGGFPEYVKYQRDEILQHLLEDILLRDIAVRYALRDVKSLQRLAWYLLSNVGKLFTASRLLSLIDLKSKSTLLEYLSYLEDAYLCFYLPKYSPSARKQLVNPRKIYVVDPGIVQANSGSMQEDLGLKLENLVFLALRRLSQDLFYFSEKHECDFVMMQHGQCQQLVQVCYEVTPENLEREVNGLLEAMAYFGFKTGTIVTFNQNDRLSYAQGNIELVAAHDWLQRLEVHPQKH